MIWIQQDSDSNNICFSFEEHFTYNILPILVTRRHSALIANSLQKKQLSQN